MQLVDIGANLTHESFQHDFATVLADASAAGVAFIILTGTDLATSEAAQLLAEQRPDYFASTVGFHPHVAESVTDDDMERAADLLKHDQVVAVGESGLDYNRNFSPPESQRRVFQQHLELASATGKPMFLHQRDAHHDFLPLLQRYRQSISGGVVHCFTDSARALHDYIELDMYIGITGWICDDRRGRELQALVKNIPDERVLLETDAPYLLPRTLSPKPATRRNEPKYLPAVAEQVARCRGQSVQAVAEATSANARRLFKLPELIRNSS